MKTSQAVAVAILILSFSAVFAQQASTTYYYTGNPLDDGTTIRGSITLLNNKKQLFTLESNGYSMTLEREPDDYFFACSGDCSYKIQDPFSNHFMQFGVLGHGQGIAWTLYAGAFHPTMPYVFIYTSLANGEIVIIGDGSNVHTARGSNPGTWSTTPPPTNDPPTASFTFTPENPTPGEEVTFTSTSTDSDGQITKWNWDFGDGTTSEGEQVTHAFAQKGQFTVTLTVTDDQMAVSPPATQAVDVQACEAVDYDDRFRIDFPQVQIACSLPALGICAAINGGLQTLPGGDGQGCLLDETATDPYGIKFQLWCGHYSNCGLINPCYGFYKVDRGGATLVGKCWFAAGANHGKIEKSRANNCYLASRWSNIQTLPYIDPDPALPDQAPGSLFGAYPPDGKFDEWEYNYSVTSNKLNISVHKDNALVFHQDPPSGSAFNDLPPVIYQPNHEYPGDKILHSFKNICDISRNGLCDTADLAIFRAALGKCRDDSGYDYHADANDDGCVDQADGRVLLNVLGDLNGDGNVNCQDMQLVRAAFGKQDGQSGYDFRADSNQDGIINVRDLAFMAQKLPAGTKCP